MKRLLFIACLFAASFAAAGAVFAQVIVPPNPSPFAPPPPPPSIPAPPPPKIEVPKIPQMDEMPRQNYVPPPRPSFGEKITTCQEQSAAAGLSPSERDVYVRACANSR